MCYNPFVVISHFDSRRENEDSMKVVNPIIKADMPDVDLLRVKDTYYMVSTTMFYVPGAPILKSKDLCNWEIVSYIFDILEDNEIYRLENGKNAYGKGQWATSLTFHNGRYYASFASNDGNKTYIFSTDDIEKSNWERVAEIDGIYHDMSFLFWEGKPYLVYGNGDIYIVELKEDLSGIREDGLNRVLFKTPEEGIMLRCEGCRALVRNGYIYLMFIEWPQNYRRREVCYRSRSLEGPYESRVIMDDDCGFEGHGVAQGTMIDSEAGEWYAMLFQDRGASGRIPFLMPAHWENDWPVFGTSDGKIPESFDIPFSAYDAKPVVISDSFNHEENKLALQWQWNHNPDVSGWSFTERPGYLRLTTRQIASGLMDARNTLTQRTIEPGCVCEVMMDAAGMRDGDYAGICAFQGRYGQIGVTVKDGVKSLFMTYKKKDGSFEKTTIPMEKDTVCLRIIFDYRNRKDKASFFFKYDESDDWRQLGDTLDMEFTLDVFVGYRVGIFCYSEKNIGGYADFRNFDIKEIQ